jgi:hypothetical protein
MAAEGQPGETVDPHPSSPLGSDADDLRKDLSTEYYAILNVITDYDQRLIVVKGWSVTLSLAAIGFGFEKGHYALFALAALTSLAFWYLDALYKGFQIRYYSRMRDIEVAAYYLNRVRLPELEEMSAPRVDWYWGYAGHRNAPKDPRKDDRFKSAPKPYVGPPGTDGSKPQVGQAYDYRHLPPWRRDARELHTLRRRAWRMPQVLFPHVLAAAIAAALFVGAATGAWPALEALGM